MVRNLIFSLIFGLIFPIFIIILAFPILPITNLPTSDCLITNGILYIIVYTSYGIFQKDSILRFAIGIAYVFLLFYFYTIGCSIFSLYLPMCSFGNFCLILNFNGTEIGFNLNIWWVIIIILILKIMSIVRAFIKPKKEVFSFT